MQACIEELTLALQASQQAQRAAERQVRELEQRLAHIEAELVAGRLPEFTTKRQGEVVTAKQAEVPRAMAPQQMQRNTAPKRKQSSPAVVELDETSGGPHQPRSKKLRQELTETSTSGRVKGVAAMPPLKTKEAATGRVQKKVTAAADPRVAPPEQAKQAVVQESTHTAQFHAKDQRWICCEAKGRNAIGCKQASPTHHGISREDGRYGRFGGLRWTCCRKTDRSCLGCKIGKHPMPFPKA